MLQWMVEIDLLVNSYERTYRRVLTLGFFDGIAAQNHIAADRYAIINNVDDRSDAERRARALVDAAEITGYTFVSDVIDRACSVTGVSRRALRRRPYFLDYGLAMAVTGSAAWVLGWDAEVELSHPGDWIAPAIALMNTRPEVFSSSPNWPARGRTQSTLLQESFGCAGDFALNWGFSDQAFLVRRDDLARPIYRRIAPASLARNAAHPWSFESRVESYQRATRRPRATHRDVTYIHNDLDDVVARLGGYHGIERWQYGALATLRKVLTRLPLTSPRWRLP
jgi:hypothetical protein